ncbi:MAG: hypothetical protein ICV81_01565 [Flavisolibacter sp.]|nr:hypothetical protein [Flavisolibacter sp.]
MILHIDDRQLIADLQDRFSDCFPFLKIEFYTKSHHWKEGTPDEYLIPASRTIGSIRKIHYAGDMTIKSWYTTGEVEKAFKNTFGLNVQIFRNENGEWVQTSATDGYSLKQQSDLARYATYTVFPKLKDRMEEFEV